MGREDFVTDKELSEKMGVPLVSSIPGQRGRLYCCSSQKDESVKTVVLLERGLLLMRHD